MKRTLLILALVVFPALAQAQVPGEVTTLDAIVLRLLGGTTDYNNFVTLEADTGSSGQVILKMQNSPAGAAGDILVDSSGRLRWIAPSGGGGMTNPMTTLGDIIYGGTAGAATRLAGNTNNYFEVLGSTAASGVAAAPAWSTFVTNYGASGCFFAGGAGNASITSSDNIGIGASVFGTGAMTGGGLNIAIGGDALSDNSANTRSENVAIGFASENDASGSDNVGIGVESLDGFNGANSGSWNTAIGAYSLNALTTGSHNTVIADGSSYNISSSLTSGSYNVQIGFHCGYSSSPTESHVMEVGGNYATGEGINDLYVGDGSVQASGATPDNFTLHATGGNGTNIHGATLGLAGGLATGNAASGPIIFESAAATTSGTTQQTLSEIARFDTAGLRLSSGLKLSYIGSASPTFPVSYANSIAGCDPTSNAMTVDLPATGLSPGLVVIVKDKTGQAAAHNITIKTTDGSTIDGTAPSTGVVISTAYGAYTFFYNGTNWNIISKM